MRRSTRPCEARQDQSYDRRLPAWVTVGRILWERLVRPVQGPALRLQSNVSSPKKHQRLPGLFVPIRSNHVTDNDPVIAAFVNRVSAAAHRRDAALEPRPTVPVDKRKRRWRRIPPQASEIGRQIALRVAEDADGEARRLVNQEAGFGLFAEAEQHERRIERQRRKRVRRHRPDLAVQLHRDHRDASDKTPHGVPEGARFDGHHSVRLSGDASRRLYVVVIFFMMTLTSSERTRSGAVHPSRLYSAMHCSAKPL